MGTTSAQKKLFFNLRKAKGRIGALEEGDLRPENVAKIAIITLSIKSLLIIIIIRGAQNWTYMQGAYAKNISNYSSNISDYLSHNHSS